ncbi:LuxR C-terminal-related transcriptional regulator [Streptomyces sp. NPDC052051]|uniref:LuxR C-terminal-related transcriptional regulator n=1 Tax=Streptomyces sp. NPDC052051 TaxID=3154649 RepID=UPI0034337EA6
MRIPAPVMILTYSREQEIVQEALRRGAGGYLVHGEFTANELVAGVRNIKEGLATFTPTAVEALAAHLNQGGRTQDGLLAPDGLGSATAHDVATTCFISERMVKDHIHRIFTKLHSTSRSEAVAKWLGTAAG